MSDSTQALLNDLDPFLQTRAAFLINSLRDLGIPAVIVAQGGRRTVEEQARLVEARLSRTMRSKHVLGRAFDLDILGYRRDDIPRDFWNALGPWAEEYLGLTWGGRWANPYDPGHFEL